MGGRRWISRRVAISAVLVAGLSAGLPDVSESLTATLAHDASGDSAGATCGASQVGFTGTVTGVNNDAGGEDFGALLLTDGAGVNLANNPGSVTVGTTITIGPGATVPLSGITSRPIILKIVELTTGSPTPGQIAAAPIVTSFTIDPGTLFPVCASQPIGRAVPALPGWSASLLVLGLLALGLWTLRRRSGALAARP